MMTDMTDVNDSQPSTWRGYKPKSLTPPISQEWDWWREALAYYDIAMPDGIDTSVRPSREVFIAQICDSYRRGCA